MKEIKITETHLQELSDIQRVTSGSLHLNQKVITSIISDGVVFSTTESELSKQGLLIVAALLRQLSQKARFILSSILILVAIIIENIATALPDKENKPKKTKEKGDLENG